MCLMSSITNAKLNFNNSLNNIVNNFNIITHLFFWVEAELFFLTNDGCMLVILVFCYSYSDR